MKQFFKFMFASMLGTFLASVLVFFFIIIVAAAIVASADGEKTVKVEENSLLHIKFDLPIEERTAKNPLENFDFSTFSSKSAPGLNDILKNIEKAKSDENIKGIYLDISILMGGYASIEEIREKLLDFKTSGKFIVAYSEIYSQKAYYLASVADEILINPQGILEFKGLSSQVMFMKGALEKLELEPQIIRGKNNRFKSAVEPLMYDKMSPENKEQVMKYMGGIWNHLVAGVSKSRNISESELNLIADSIRVQTAADAVHYKLADKIAFKDEVLDNLRKRLGLEETDKIKFVTLNKYTKAPKSKDGEGGLAKDKIAVIYCVGGIEGGNGDNKTIGSEKISETIRKARLDDKIKAIVLRINSPGGSALASDVIWREVVLAKAVKPVIVSMGDVAASGGYYIACAADSIVADPNTITGSIGVFGVLMNTKKLLNNKLGITVDTVKTNRMSDFASPFRALNSAETDIIQRNVEEIYDIFITHVAKGRNMTKEKVDSIGQGRVWSGVDAKKLGLVDELGGIDKAISIAAGKAKLEKYRIVEMPEEKDPLQAMLKEISGEGEDVFMRMKLGENYKYYQMVNDNLKLKGIQARLPYEIQVD